MPSGYQIIQLAWWLGLSTWFGGVLFIAIAAPVIFRTIRENKPILPTVLSVNLEDQHGTLLAGTIVGNLLALLSKVQMVCAGVLTACYVLQFFVVDLSGSNLTAAIVRGILLFIAIAIVIYDRWRVWPELQLQRTTYLDNADDPDIANPARERFDLQHRLSVALLSTLLFLLLGVILFSANIVPEFHYTDAGSSLSAGGR